MADNYNTYQTIGDTVSFDSLYRGIENMGKAMATARAAKAKANLKKDEQLSKMILDKQMVTGMTPLWSIKNLDNYKGFITTSSETVTKDPNNGINQIPTLFANYQQQADLTKQQSEVEKNIRTAQQQGFAVKSDVVKAYDEAYAAGGNMQWFTNPNNSVFLARQGIYVTPDKKSTVTVDGKSFDRWGYISTDLSKAKNLTEELDKVIKDDNNFDKTENITGDAGTIKGSTKGYQTATKTATYTMKAGKQASIAEDYSNDKEIQRFYLVNDELFKDKVDPLFQTYKNNTQYAGFSDAQLLSMAAKDAIKTDILNTDFSKKKNDLLLLSPPSSTHVTVNNAIKDNTVIGAGSDKKIIDSGTSAVSEALNTKDQLNNAAKLLKDNNNNPVQYKMPNGKTVIFKYGNLEKKEITATYANEVDEQSAGLQQQRIKQGSRKEDAITYKPGDFSTQVLVDPTTLSKVDASKVLGISQDWQIEDYTKVGDQIYAKITAQIPGGQGKGVAMKGQNSYYIKVNRNSKFDKIGAGEYNVKSMYDWKGWSNTTTSNESNVDLN